MLKASLIANRGEIACRIIRTARRLGLRTVAVYSEADRGALHVRMADEAVCIGLAPAATVTSKCDTMLAVVKHHPAPSRFIPDTDFCRENADFAEPANGAGRAPCPPVADRSARWARRAKHGA